MAHGLAAGAPTGQPPRQDCAAYPDQMTADGQRYAGPGSPICEARASACVSTYSRILVSLPSRIVIAKIQSSSNVLSVALIFPRAKPMTSTRFPCSPTSYLANWPRTRRFSRGDPYRVRQRYSRRRPADRMAALRRKQLGTNDRMKGARQTPSYLQDDGVLTLS